MADALRSLDCMQVAFCRGVARGFTTCARERLRFATLSIGLAAQMRRGSTAVQFCAVPAAYWTVAGRSRRQYASPSRVRRHFAGLILAASKHEPRSHAKPPLHCDLK